MEAMSQENHAPVVYYMTHSDYQGAVKIGTTVNLKSRLRRFERGRNQKFTFLAFELGDKRLESARHKQFAKYRIIGEWFFHDEELADYIEALQQSMSEQEMEMLKNEH